MHYTIFILSLLFPFLSIVAQPKHEVRAAWVTAVYGLDWPRTRATTPQTIRKQKEELIDILDKLKAANFNTVLFQTRTRGDVLYPSAIEPFNSILTGKTGGNPGYDPLAFAIEECHKRGMECHAWMVTIPLGNKKHVASLGSQSVTKRMKEICVPYKREYFLNPGHPATKEYLMKLVREVVSGYDVDGVHFDYLRYPENAPLFPDKYDFRRYNKGRTLEQWRRAPEAFLAAAVNGAVFQDPLGVFSAVRERLLAFYPEDVRRKKLAARLAVMAQAGQYNYPRCLRRGEPVAAQQALAAFTDAAMSAVYLMNRRYAPFYKWRHRGLRGMERLPDAYERLEALVAAPDGPERAEVVEAICWDTAEELRRQGLSSGTDAFLLPHAEKVRDGIRDPVLRKSHVMEE